LHAARSYADVERRLGEVDRARAIYGHAAQFCDPRIEAAFWQVIRARAVPRLAALRCAKHRLSRKPMWAIASIHGCADVERLRSSARKRGHVP
jgi:hypothetical protein